MLQQPQRSPLPAFMAYERLGASCGVALHQFRNGNTVHAYLLTGARGLGKRTFARVLTSALFCVSEDKPCGICVNCRRVLNGNEPDVITLFADDGKQIGVDRVRDTIRAVNQHAFGSGVRVVMIEPVERMTPQAQNCLLKSLEEPLVNVVFLLMTHELTATLGTIASRCARIKLTPWPDDILSDTLETLGYEREKIREALGLCGGNIGAAVDLLDDAQADDETRSFVRDALSLKTDASVLNISTKLKEKRDESERLLSALEQAVHQALLVKANLLPLSALNRYPELWRNSIPKAGEESLNRMLTAIFEARRRRLGQVNWQSTVDHLMMTLLEEEQAWQQS